MSAQPEPLTNTAPRGASSLAEILDLAAEQGHNEEFVAVIEDRLPRLRCPHCGLLGEPAATALLWATRLEGASDPADMAYVAALRCSRCRATGVYIAQYGPAAGAADAAVLPLLQEPGAPDRAPDRD